MNTDALFGIAGKHAIVTGSSRGIGRACALYLAQAGVSVAVNYRTDLDAAEETLAQIRAGGGNGVVIQADVSTPEGVRQLCQAAEEKLGHIDILVSNVGIGSKMTAEELSCEEFLRMLQTNLFSHAEAVKQLLAGMKACRWGRIICISSVVGRSGKAFIGTSPAYAAAKGALISYTRSLARECGPYGITANSICPGWIDWPGKNRPVTEAFRAAAIREMPVGRTGTAQDVAGAAVFLASNLAEYVNGVALDVNGGLYMA